MSRIAPSSDVVERWIRTLRGDTSRTYGSVLRKLATEQDPLSCSPLRLEAFVKAASTVRMRQRRVSALHRFYAFALDERILDADPSRRLYLRNLNRQPTSEILVRVGASNDATVFDLLRDRVGKRRLRWTSSDGKDLLKRLYGAISAASSPMQLLDILKSKAGLSV